MSDGRAVAHGRDYTAHAAMDNARRALRQLKDPVVHNGRLYASDLKIVQDLYDRLSDRAAQIVRAWD